MVKPQFMLQDDFKTLEKTVVLLHGCFNKDFFKLMKDRVKETFFITEGRPSLRSAQSNCSQLNKIGVKPTLICDNMAGFLFSKDMVKEVWIAYDGKDEEGLTVAIGGSILSILATRHQVPVFAFRSDKKTPVLADKNELLNFQGRRIAPKGAKTYAPLVEHVEHKFFTNVID